MAKKLYKEIDFKENLKKYLAIAGKYKAYFIGIIILVLFVETGRLFDKYLFKILVDDGTDFASGSLARADFTHTLLLIALAFVIVLFVKVVFNWIKEGFMQKLEANMMRDIKVRFFNHIVDLDHNFHTTHKTGSLISRMGRGTRASEALTDFFVYSIAPLVLQVVIIGGTLLFLDWISAVVIVLISVTFVAFGFFMSHLQKEAHVESYTAEDIEKANLGDVFMNIDSVKYFGKEKSIKKRFGQFAEDSRIKLIRFWKYGRLFGTGQSLILGTGTFALMFFSIGSFLDGNVTIGTLAFIYTAYLGLMGPLFGFVHGIRRFYISLGDFDSLFQYGKIKNSIKDKENASTLKVKTGDIEFKKVNFTYHKRKVINNLSLKAKKNQKIALVGHSGSGKTTLVKLLYRFYDINSGEILVDGKNIKEYQQESLRSEMSVVTQDSILFDDTIYNNIKFSNPCASKEEVMKAIKMARLDRFVSNLPKKENTIVGERGVKLSGGEKQRVSIARAILANKKILVLDEATSALDSKTEYEIQQALKKLMEGRTSIIIAHRLSTIMSADNIVVMEKGKIVQQGKHRDLIKKHGQYKELWNLQKGGYIEE